MAITITIQGQIIEIPSSAESPNWSTGIIEAFQAIEAALSGLTGPFDISPKIMDISSYNGNTTAVDITDGVTALAFPTSNVRAAFIEYSVFRTVVNGIVTTSAYEAGHIIAIYNPNGTIGSLWEMSSDFVGDALITFYISDTGQISFKTGSMTGSAHAGKISFSAKALLQS